MISRVSSLSHNLRKKDAHRKFLLGLSFEKAGLAILNNDYIESDFAFSMCEDIINSINNNDGSEHLFYKSGQTAFDSKLFMNNEEIQKQLQNLFGDDWKKTRYHNLVRLGGDVVRSGLAEFPKAVILGGLLITGNRYLESYEGF